jgi:iron complex transport system substrate-binding protein
MEGMRIASLQPSVSLTLAALDRLDCLCAVTKYCIDAMPELAARNLPILSDSWSFDRVTPESANNLETLLAVKPSLVIASVPYRIESLAAILKSGVPVLALAPRCLADVYADIRLIAAHVAAEPGPLIERMHDTIAATRALTAYLKPEDRPLVYCEEWGKPMIHSQAWVAELVEAAGGRFFGTAGVHTDAAIVAAADPDVLLFAWCGAGDRVPLARVIEQRGWQGLGAVREGRAHVIPDEFLNTPAPSLLDGLACIAAALNPMIYPPHPRLVALR